LRHRERAEDRKKKRREVSGCKTEKTKIGRRKKERDRQRARQRQSQRQRQSRESSILSYTK
jgi:hypothetical protein